MSKSELVTQNLKKGYNCAQAIMEAYAVNYGLSREQALKLSHNLGGGFAFRGELCGAVSAALLIYGLHFGSDRVHDELSEEIIFHLSSEHTRKFIELHGTLQCKELLGCNMNNQDDFSNLMDDDFFKMKCFRFVLDSVQILEQNIRETENKIK
jgi:C_GCAxxG_C_C family probable redox protein